MTQTVDLPPMQELRASNDLLDEPERLRERLAEDGYVLLRGVLDADAIADARRAFLEVLAEGGYVASADDTEHPVYTGPADAGRRLDLEALYERGVWQRLVGTPSVTALFERIMGEEVTWVPITEYRATPPVSEAPADPFAGRHQDGFFNEGIPFTICWVALSEIGPETGGLAIAAGENHRGFLHDPSLPNQHIPDGAIPRESWARTTYRPGDLLLFTGSTPHSGLANLSGDGLRLSLDLRVMPVSADPPLIGPVVSSERGSITVDDQRLGPTTLTVDDDTYIRGGSRAEVPLDHFKPGDGVIVPYRDGRATIIRPAR